MFYAGPIPNLLFKSSLLVISDVGIVELIHIVRVCQIITSIGSDVVARIKGSGPRKRLRVADWLDGLNISNMDNRTA